MRAEAYVMTNLPRLRAPFHTTISKNGKKFRFGIFYHRARNTDAVQPFVGEPRLHMPAGGGLFGTTSWLTLA
jgi:hypothetical protein